MTPKDHFVQFYAKDDFLAGAVSDFIGAGLQEGEAAVVIATPAHRAGIRGALLAKGVDAAVFEKSGQYTELDAAETLQKFMVDGCPDERLFSQVVGSLVRARLKAHGKARAFGEMVGLLWADGNRNAAIRLEALWNELKGANEFAVFCAYPIDGFQHAGDAEDMLRVCDSHSRVLPTERMARPIGEEQRFREFVLLEQKAAALEREVAKRKQAEAALRKGEEQWRRLISLMPTAVYTCDIEGRITYYNRRAVELWGREPALNESDQKFCGALKLWLPDGSLLPHEKTPMAAALTDGTPSRNREVVIERPDGSRSTVCVNIDPLLDENGVRCGAINVFQDITPLKQGEEQLRKKTERLEILAETLEHLIDADDPDTIVRELFPKVAAHVRADTYFNFMVNEKGDALTLHSCAGIPEETARGIERLEFGQAICGTVAQSCVPIHATDIQTSDYDKAALVRSFGIQCYACNPLMVGERLLGTLSFASRSRRAFEDDELQFLRIVSQYTAVALDRLQSAAKLRESHERFRAVLDNSLAVIYVKDCEGKYLLINKRYEELFNTTERALAGKTDFDLFPPEFAQRFRENDLEVIKQGRAIEAEETALHDDGVRFYISIKFPLRKSDGSIYAVAGISTDITERKRAQEAMQRLAAIVESSDDAIISKDLQGVITSWNMGAERVFGYSAEEAIGRPVTMLMPPERASEESDILDRIRRGERIDHYETVRQRKDGTPLHISLSVSAMKDENGNIVGASKVARDITERRRTEAMIATQKEALEMAARGAPLLEVLTFLIRGIEAHAQFVTVAIHLLDKSGTRFGQTAAPSLPASYLEAVDGMEIDSLTGPCCLAIQRREQVVVGDVAACTQFPKFVRFVLPLGIKAAWSAPIISSTGVLLGSLAHYYRDSRKPDARDNLLKEIVARTASVIIERRQAEENLERKVEERTAKLRETIHELESYSYSISHDMRAPLRAMQAYSQVLVDELGPKLDETNRRYLNRITAAANRLDKLITDVLSYSRLARGDIDLKPVDLDGLVEEIVYQYPAVGKAQLSISPKLGTVMGAEALLTQAIANLLTNAAKFVAPGVTPRINIWAEEMPLSGNPGIKLLIQDNGIGITPRDHERIFGMFVRVQSDKSYEGTGIGLSIVKKAVERMKGRVGVDSEPDKGSTFWIHLPKA